MRTIALAAALTVAAAANAQLPPIDAGGQLRDAEKKPPALPRKPPPRLELESPARPPLAASGVSFTVRDFRFSGNTVFPSSLLGWVLYDFRGRELGFAELEEAAAKVTRYYRERGYLVARAYLPQQEIRDGVVEIAVLEGRLGGVELKNESRVRDSAVTGHFAALGGEVVREERLERKLLLLSDLPGIGRAGAALRPGERVGESAMALELARPDAPAASIEFDNYGSYYTGEWRLSGAFELASPTGYGDLASVRVTKGMPGLDLVQLGYQLPIGRDGLRAGVSYSGLKYRLGKEFASLDAHGEAQSASATLSYPFVRQRTHNVTAHGAFAHRELEDRIDATSTVTEKTTNVGTLGVAGDWRDALGGGSVNVWSVSVAGGALDIETTAALVADAASARSDGSFQKLNWSFVRAQRLEDRWSALFTLTGQRASKNLDSSEKFVLGGPYGVRAFPLGEAAGDQGMLGAAELRFDLTPALLQAFAFVDAGEVKIHHDPFAGSGENERTLNALGIGVNWTAVRSFSARGILAWGSEASTSAPDRRPRAWLQLVARL